MAEDHEHTDDELITKLSEEYEIALNDGDRERIDDDIAPRFWARFGSFFNQYRTMWAHASEPDDEKDRYMLSEPFLGKMQMEWMDQVLRGEIELGDEMDEEPSET